MRLFILYLFFFVNFSFAQNNTFNLSVVFAPKLIKNIPAIINDYQQRFYEDNISFNVGLNFNYYVSRYRLIPELSILWSSIQYRSQSFGSVGVGVLDVNSKFIQIPFGLGYRIINRKIFNLDLTLGINYGKLIKSNNKISCDDNLCNTNENFMNQSVFSTFTGLKTSFTFNNQMFISSQLLLNLYKKGFDHLETHSAFTYQINFGLGYSF